VITHGKAPFIPPREWIELAEKAVPRPGNYALAGVNRDDNAWLYVIGNYDIVFGFSKSLLQALAASGKYPHKENTTKTSVGFLLPEDHAQKYAAFILAPKAEQRIEKAVKDLHELGRQLHSCVLENPAQRSLFPDLF